MRCNRASSTRPARAFQFSTPCAASLRWIAAQRRMLSSATHVGSRSHRLGRALDSGSTGSLNPAAPAVERDETVSRNWCSRAARSSRAPPEARINQSHVGSRLSPSWSPLDSGSTGSLDPAAPAVERDGTASCNWCSRAPARAELHQRRGSTSPTLGRALTAGRARTTRRRTHASLARPSTPYGAVRPARTESGKQAGGEGWFDDVHAAGVACLPLA
jgi:hypothetical protein